MKPLSLAVAIICGTSALAVQAAEPNKMPTVYGELSGRVAHFNDTNFLGDEVDTTPTVTKAILGAKGLYVLSPSVKLAYRLEADFAPVAENDSTESIYYTASDKMNDEDDNIFIRYASAALITDYGLFGFGENMSGVYSEFYAAADPFEINTQDSTPQVGTNGSRMWTQTKWSQDGIVYKTPVWNNFFVKMVYASIDNRNGTDDDLKIIHGVYKTDNFMFGVNLSIYDKELGSYISPEDTDRERWVVASHYKYGPWMIAGVYEMNRDVGYALGGKSDFDVYAVTGTYTSGKFSYALSYQDREEPDGESFLTEDSAVIGMVKYAHDEHFEFWAEAGAYDESEYDNIGVGFNVKF